MQADNVMFMSNQMLMLISGGLGLLLLISLGVLFFVSRRSQRVMQSLLMIMTRPERAKVQDASRVLQTLLGDEMAKIDTSFRTMRETLDAQIAAAGELKKELGAQNEQLVTLANDATQKLAQMSQRLDNTVSGLKGIVDSETWGDVSSSADKFTATVDDLLARIGATSHDTTEQITKIQTQIDGWVASGQTLSENLRAEFESNASQMETMTANGTELQTKLSDIARTTAEGFETVKTASADYSSIMDKNKKMLADHLSKLDTYTKQSSKQLTNQVNTITTTANVVAGQIRLSESSIEQQIAKLTQAVESLMSSAVSTENAVRGITNELALLTNRFDGEIKEFATGVVSELRTVSGVANTTLENTKSAAGAFSDSVRAMATGVRETLIEMNTAHTQLSGQSESLIKMSAETTEQLRPLSELIEKYYAALPDLSRDSAAAGETLDKIVTNLNDKINIMKSTVAESTETIGASALKLEDFAGQSRQQMIDLMSDYAKAVDTMQTLNKQMMVARATAPMDAIKAAPSESFGHVSSTDFIKQSERVFAKMHEQALDLTRATGAEIPDVVWKKYHAGDTTIFSKWLAKMLAAADKKRVRDMLKSDAVFRSQATQFVRSFDKVMVASKQTDSPETVAATLLKTDLGRIYAALKGQL